MTRLMGINMECPHTQILFALTLALMLSACGGDNGKKQPNPPPHNQSPIADAGADISVDEGTLVELAGTGTDNDGTITSYAWRQDSGTSVTITNADTANASFDAPGVSATEDLLFSLTVTDNDGATASDTVTITVLNVNVAPVANAGPNQDAITGLPVTLNGTASSDEDGDPLTYSWALISVPTGSSATINGATTTMPSFTPDVDGSYSVELVVNDGSTNSTPSAVTVVSTTPPFGTLGDGQLETMTDTVRALYDLPAITVVVVKDGAIAEWASVGKRSVDFPDLVATTDKWHIGSLTKAITGTLVGMYVEQSLLDWSTRPLDVWPELVQSIHPAYVDVTIAQLLSHRAGLAIQAYDVPSEAALQDSAPGTVTEKRRLWAEELLALPPDTPVGSYRYTNSGYIVAGAMLESLTGDAWENMLQMNLFGPLGMTNSGFGAPGVRDQIDQPRGHREISGVLRPVEPGPGSDNVMALGPAGTIHTTMADYASFMMMHIDGANSINGLVTTQTFDFLHTPPEGSYYSIGWIVETHPNEGGRVFLHTGSNLRWKARVRLMPGIAAGIFLVINAYNADAEGAMFTLERQITERILDTP